MKHPVPTIRLNPPPAAIPLPLLVTGITGVVGFNAFRAFRQCYPGQVIGIRPQQTWQLVGQGIVAQNAEDCQGMRELFQRYRFRSVLNCAGNCALKSCELDPLMARQLNVESAIAIVDNVVKLGCRLVHLSSDLVFSGKGMGNYRELDPIDPVTVYGQTMAEAEALVAQKVPSAAILRISLPMGPSFNRHAGAIDWIQSRFRKGRPATLYFDEIRSCTYVADLNRIFALFLSSQLSGLFHAGGPRAVSLYQIAQIVNRVGGYDPRLLHGCLRFAAGPIPPRAGNVSMNSAKLHAALTTLSLHGEESGELASHPFRPWPMGDDIFPTDPMWHYRRNAAEPGSLELLCKRLYHYPEKKDRRWPAVATTIGLVSDLCRMPTSQS